ncbi:hypothetical protein GGR50DRAFT_209985 [Xylaria sp. CBS 124048]|nr:hypothetical protein GGR50DRAFT_209985 [Xylaria sp. CBS 124048]
MRPSIRIRVSTCLAYHNRSFARGSPISGSLILRGKAGIYRFYSSESLPTVGAVVVGAGPGGITVVGNLLEHTAQLEKLQSAPFKPSLVWVDPHFKGGRVNGRYREVPSNTKVNLFLQFATAVSAFRHIAKTTPEPNALTALKQLPQDQGCSLSHAADMCMMLTAGLAKHRKVSMYPAKLAIATLNEANRTWTVELDTNQIFTTSMLVLCTGSSPISKTLPAIESLHPQGLKSVDLDTALTPSVLAKTFDPAANTIVAVVGASHSAILVLMNLVQLAGSSHPNLRVKWFTRHPLRYAEYMDGWILRDNTGLKGQAADWARNNLDAPSAFVDKVITKIWTQGKEEESYKAELPGCTHIVQAVGYVRDPLPQFEVIAKENGTPAPLDVEYDDLNGRFYRSGQSASPKQAREYVPGLFGAGIAFPERVTDPYGNVEHAVGFWKFMKYMKRVVPEWVGKP